MPIIRYDVGDLGRFLPGVCACGRTVRLFELQGRGDDTVRVGTNLVPLASIAKAIGKVPGLGQAFRMVVRKEGALDHLILEAETFQPLGAGALQELEAMLLDRLQGEMEDVAKEMRDPGTGRLTLRVLLPGELPRNPRTGKIKQVVDERRA
jgi:phenylacetate-coenzyme A ligase PaaK-like adenylate-forming protein